MCGRFTLYHPREEIEDLFEVTLPPEFGARYNIAPTQPVLIVRENPFQFDGMPEAAHVIWGLIPPWAEDPKIGSRMINARCETAAEKPSFRNSLRRRRCVIPASGFYEWETTADRRKMPWLIQFADEGIMALAGLWEVWNGPDGEQIESCTILTTAAGPALRDLHEGLVHDRMPVIIPAEEVPVWLDRQDEDTEGLARYFGRGGQRDLTVRPVSPEINKVGEYREDDGCGGDWF